jgi:hypothetical protein
MRPADFEEDVKNCALWPFQAKMVFDPMTTFIGDMP